MSTNVQSEWTRSNGSIGSTCVNGIVTPGVDASEKKLDFFKMPASLAGKTVLDIGAWDGFFSFEAERRGAARVLATDSFCWSGEGWGTKDGFQLARRILGSKVEEKDIDVMDLSPEAVGQFDVVLFLGVLYHLKHPMLALERVASVTKEMLIMETHVDFLTERRPAMALYQGLEVNEDPTNWCGPNIAALRAMLRIVGFTRVEVVNKYSVGYRVVRAVFQRLRAARPFRTTVQQGRVAVHAWK